MYLLALWAKRGVCGHKRSFGVMVFFWLMLGNGRSESPCDLRTHAEERFLTWQTTHFSCQKLVLCKGWVSMQRLLGMIGAAMSDWRIDASEPRNSHCKKETNGKRMRHIDEHTIESTYHIMLPPNWVHLVFGKTLISRITCVRFPDRFYTGLCTSYAPLIWRDMLLRRFYGYSLALILVSYCRHDMNYPLHSSGPVTLEHLIRVARGLIAFFLFDRDRLPPENECKY